MSSFTLKWIALVLMVIDHVGAYFGTMPVWLRWLGRGSYPLFLFCMVWGYYYTKSRKKYIARLYSMSIFMTFFTYIIDNYFPSKVDYGNHNIFLSLMIVGILISTIELFQKNRKKGYMALAGIFLVQVIYYMLPSFIPALRNVSGDFLTGIVPNIVLNEYGVAFIALGVGMYFLKEKKELLSVFYVLFCICQFSVECLETGTATQWMMIIALPLILSFNNQKGRGIKGFFYLFYPAHTFLLFYFSVILGS